MNHMKKMGQRGFTLIELLVVIAIIGLLAAVVLAAVGTARTKGTDTAVKTQLESARNQGEVYASGNIAQTYLGVCNATTAASDPGMGGAAGPGILYNAAKVTGGAAQVDAVGAAATATCNDTASGWAMQAPLTATTGGYWCVDSTGASLRETTAFTAATTITCPTT